MVKYEKISVTTTGSAGSATGSTTTFPVNGFLYGVYLDYHASAPGGTTDVTIAQADGPAQTLLTVTDNATDGWYFPRAAVQDNAGADVTFDGTNEIYELYPVSGELTVSVAQSNALTDCVVAHLFVKE